MSASSSKEEANATNHQKKLRFVDIGANLLDEMYTGSYRDKQRHEADIHEVFKRSKDVGLEHIVLTAGTLVESKRALEYARKLSDATTRVYGTVGVHPTRCNEFFGDNEDEEEEVIQNHIRKLIDIAKDGMSDGTIVMVGELGLDYDRLQFCDKEMQKKGFVAQLQIAKETGLPLFLHNRNTGMDLLDLLTEHRSKFNCGVVHSYDDSSELAQKFVDLGLYIGINGCSLKKEENLEVVKSIPLDRILLETDCPWCDIRQTHAGSKFLKTTFPTKKEKQFEMGCCVKNRNEPCHIVQVAEVVAGARGMAVEDLANACFENSMKFFGDFKTLPPRD